MTYFFLFCFLSKAGAGRSRPQQDEQENWLVDLCDLIPTQEKWIQVLHLSHSIILESYESGNPQMQFVSIVNTWLLGRGIVSWNLLPLGKEDKTPL